MLHPLTPTAPVQFDGKDAKDGQSTKYLRVLVMLAVLAQWKKPCISLLSKSSSGFKSSTIKYIYQMLDDSMSTYMREHYNLPGCLNVCVPLTTIGSLVHYQALTHFYSKTLANAWIISIMHCCPLKLMVVRRLHAKTWKRLVWLRHTCIALPCNPMAIWSPPSHCCRIAS